jgi:tetrapyrrole methylase family protein/MazG family protein
MKKNSFDDLIKIMKKLRSPKGCPWDKRQTHKSLIKYLKEESEELIENINNNLLHHDLKEELGDILLQVIFHAQIAKEDGRFDIYDVVDNLAKKLKRRHPHVFGRKKAKNINDVYKIWKTVKAKEKSKAK